MTTVRTRHVALLVGLASAVLSSVLTSVACKSPAADGGSCEQDSDCKSGACVASVCAGGACSCTSGSPCQAECAQGWVCVGSLNGIDGARCRSTCTTVNGDGDAGARSTGCLANEHCEDGVCKAGAEPPRPEWANVPRQDKCRSGSRCPFAVRVHGGSGIIDAFRWTFSDDPDAGVTTQDGSVEHRYLAGTWTTRVEIVDHNGTSAAIQTTDSVCVDGVGSTCVLDQIECCSGSCLNGTCK